MAGDEYDNPGLTRLLGPAADVEALRRVLGDSQIGDFGVEVIRNGQAYVIQDRIEALFSEARLDDVLLLHFSCHGLKSESGELFFAARNTVPTRLRSTAVSANFVQDCMRESRSRRIVVLLDCCFGGAFSKGVAVRAAAEMNVLDSFRTTGESRGRGRAVITASSAMEYAFEAEGLVDGHVEQPSVFTSALVEGLATGDADLNEDGLISLNELYDYVFERVRERNPNQTPSRDIEMQGDLHIAYNRRQASRPDMATSNGLEPKASEHAEAVPVTQLQHPPPESVESGVTPAQAEKSARVRRTPARRRPRMLVIAGAAALIAGVAIYLAAHGDDGPTSDGGGRGPITALPRDEMVVPERTAAGSNLTLVSTANRNFEPLVQDGERPALSPNRKTILFLRKDASGFPVPYIMDANGDNQRLFVRTGSGEGKCAHSDPPALSASGEYVAMFCLKPGGNVPYREISIFESDGTYVRPIPVAGSPTGFLTWVRDDGIVFGQAVGAGNGLASLWQVEHVLGTPRPPMDLSKAWKPGYYDLPDWSASHGLLFQRKKTGDEESGYLDVWNMDPSQGPQEVRPRGKDMTIFRGAAWSPDGDQLVFWWLPDKHNQSLSYAKYRDRDRPGRWNLLFQDEATSQSNPEAPDGKAQPAWGTL